MKNLIVTFLFLWLSVGVFSELLAQGSDMEDYGMTLCFQPYKPPPHTYFGILSSLNLGQLSSYTPGDLNGNPLTTIEHNPHARFSLGVRLEYLLGDVKNPKSFITADVMFGRMGFEYSAQDSVQSTTLEKMLGQYSLTTTASAFTLNAYYTHLLPGTYLGITAGITTSYIFNVEHYYSVTASRAILPSASTISTSDSGRTMQYADTSAADVNRLQLGVVAGLRYDILLGRVVLTPFAQFEHGLNGILSGGKERMQVFRVGVTIIFAL
ncbi:MAG: outer membrane beta-barrel protein [Ignavibacteria bacterium]|nr:outer membrane beta-barrel protein [Ignavibacteria bacterium]